MNAVIVEDEIIAAQSLERLIYGVDESIKVMATLQSVDEAVEWFSTHNHPDVVFMDIHLADGESFTIFQQIEIRSPIIFTTAYDEYALKAFEVNSIDYLLKPITRADLKKALDKMRQMTHKEERSDDKINQLLQSMKSMKEQQRRHFLIPYKDKLIPISADDIAYVYSEEKMAKVVCYDKKEYTMDLSLDELLRQLSPDQFFRANRQYIIAHQAIADISLWFNGKLSVNLTLPTPERIIISRARATLFKEWYIGGIS